MMDCNDVDVDVDFVFVVEAEEDFEEVDEYVVRFVEDLLVLVLDPEEDG